MQKDDFGPWSGIAGRPELDGVVSSIVCGRGVSESAPDSWIEDLAPDSGTVLDLGCGVGRNLIPLAMERPDLTVVGYDSAAMVGRIAEYSVAKYREPVPSNVRTIAAPDWDSVTDESYDVAFVSLVFQHLQPAAIFEYVEDLKAISSVIVVYGRRANDHSQKTTWELLEECGLYPDNADEIDYSPRGHSEDHYLCVYRIR